MEQYNDSTMIIVEIDGEKMLYATGSGELSYHYEQEAKREYPNGVVRLVKFEPDSVCKIKI